MIEVEKSDLGYMEERVQVRTGGRAVHSCVCVCVFLLQLEIPWASLAAQKDQVINTYILC